MTSKILLTGATGTIGTELVKQLKHRGVAFSIMTARPGRGIAGATEVLGDFADPATLTRAFAGVDTLFLLFPFAPNAIDLARNAVAAAQAAGVKHIVRSSGIGADSTSPMAIAKMQGEIDDLVVATGIPYTLLRPAAFMQNHLNFNAAQIKAGAVHAPRGAGATSIVDVRDIAEVAAKVLLDPAAHAGQAYELTGPEALTEAQQMAIISRALGRTVKYIDVPEQAAIDAMVGMGMAPKVIEWFMSLNHIIKMGWAAGLSEDVAKLTEHPPRSFEAFVRDHVSAWQ
jgi:uncharacterized protein YbjT (DUF2867 family)